MNLATGGVEGKPLGYDSSWDILSETVALSHYKTKKDYSRLQEMSNKVLNRQGDSDERRGASVWRPKIGGDHSTSSYQNMAHAELASNSKGSQKGAEQWKVGCEVATESATSSERATAPNTEHVQSSQASIPHMNRINNKLDLKCSKRTVINKSNAQIQILPENDLSVSGGNNNGGGFEQRQLTDRHSTMEAGSNGRTANPASGIKMVMTCFRCCETVYPKELVEPRKGVTLHEWCLRCDECGLKLTLNTFVANPKDNSDPRVFCKNHAPQLEAAKMDHQAKGICSYQQVPKINTFNKEIRGPDAGRAAKFDSGALCIKVALNAPKLTDRTSHNPTPHEVVKSDVIGLRYF